MIFRCKCGALKTGQPFRSAGEVDWTCPRCTPGKPSKEGSDSARMAAKQVQVAYSSGRFKERLDRVEIVRRKEEEKV